MFNRDLKEAFTAANIPLYKLQTPDLKYFLREYTNKTIHDASYYRKILNPLFLEQKEKIFNLLRNQDIYLLFDETTDVNGSFILNILAGVCCKSSRSQTYLVRTVELSKTNSETVGQEIIDLMVELYEGSISYDKLRLIVSDAAPYEVKAVKDLRCLLTNLKHIKCVAHMLHRLCEKLREISPLSNMLSSKLKRILVKKRENQFLFKTFTNLKLPNSQY
ncbi:hypothetical protein DMUE_0158 [Dictyocoela muelleri]|nr:hypothetical protein DMUE_0158 [Dictyocoela muelleri]